MELGQSSEGLSEQIAKHIAEQIILGELVEGERIQEVRIATELDVSRGSVREALLLLQRTYLIEIFPRRGAIVSEMSSGQIHYLFETSLLVLGYLVQQISDAWQSAEQAEMQKLLDQLSVFARSGDFEGFYEAIFEFLTAYNQKMDNFYLSNIYQSILPSIRRAYYLTSNSAKRELQEAYALFQLVIDAILRRNAQQATLFVDDFCRHLRNLVLESLARMKQVELAWARRSRR